MAHLRHCLAHTRSYMSFREEASCQYRARLVPSEIYSNIPYQVGLATVSPPPTNCREWEVLLSPGPKHLWFGVITCWFNFIIAWHWDRLCRVLCLSLVAIEAFVIPKCFRRVGLIYTYMFYALWNFSHIYVYALQVISCYDLKQLGRRVENQHPAFYPLNRLPLHYAHVFILPCLFYVITLVVYLPRVYHICNDRLLRKIHNSKFIRNFTNLCVFSYFKGMLHARHP